MVAEAVCHRQRACSLALCNLVFPGPSCWWTPYPPDKGPLWTSLQTSSARTWHRGTDFWGVFNKKTPKHLHCSVFTLCLSLYLLKRAGDVAALSFRPSDEGFMVKTTWRFLMTWLVNHLYSSSCVSSIRPSFWAPSLHWVIKVAYSSPSKRPGTYILQVTYWEAVSTEGQTREKNCCFRTNHNGRKLPLRWPAVCSFSQGNQNPARWTHP